MAVCVATLDGVLALIKMVNIFYLPYLNMSVITVKNFKMSFSVHTWNIKNK